MFDYIETYFTSWRFPVFMVMTLFLSWLLIMVMAFMPVSDTAFGAFAQDFKVLCFKYNPETGSFQWIYLFMFTINPIILTSVILFVWHEPLKQVFASPSIIKNHALLAALLVTGVSVSFLALYEVPPEQPLEFKAEALRTSLNPPKFELINHHNEPVSLSDYEGKVVILTSIYASCSDTCPMILEQIKSTLDDLAPAHQKQVQLIAITMQPEKDTPELLNKVVRFQKLEEYNAQLLTGNVKYVNSILDKLNVARFKEEGSADISHANLFLVLDREGKIAYRFTLGELQQNWMTQALKLLVSEEMPKHLTKNTAK